VLRSQWQAFPQRARHRELIKLKEIYDTWRRSPTVRDVANIIEASSSRIPDPRRRPHVDQLRIVMLLILLAHAFDF